jgi:hypothetical protein
VIGFIKLLENMEYACGNRLSYRLKGFVECKFYTIIRPKS